MCVLLLVQYGLGIGVNLFVTMPGRDHGAGLGAAIANGPVAVSIHAVLGLALIVVRWPPPSGPRSSGTAASSHWPWPAWPR